jgi:hypothetical protein
LPFSRGNYLLFRDIVIKKSAISANFTLSLDLSAILMSDGFWQWLTLSAPRKSWTEKKKRSSVNYEMSDAGRKSDI